MSVDAATRHGVRWRLPRVAGCLLLSIVTLGLLPASRPAAQVRSPYSDGLAGLLQKIQALRTTASAMYVAAHPDDEDSALIARWTRGDHARAAYLALNRGEGGQNIIGPELFDALGVIRTEELLQARALDGGRQFFTRAFDYGFSKTLAEAKAKWNETAVLADAVRAIRTFRPFVVVSRFSGTPADGHGQHQFAGYLAPRAFRAAGDPARFPEQIAEGLRPWQAVKLYQGRTFRDAGLDYPVHVETGRYDPTLGRTYFEIAMQGRSQHKTQQMGVLELRGPHASRLRLVESRVATVSPDDGLFAGIDTSVPGIAVTAGLPPGALLAELETIEQAAARALRQFDVLAPAATVPPLADGLRAVRAARAALDTLNAPPRAKFDADFLLARKERQFEAALQQAAGIVVDVLADRETVSPGEAVGVAIHLFAGGTPVEVEDARLRGPARWTIEPAPGLQVDAGPRFRIFRETPDRSETFRVTVPDDAPWTQPYWLTAPRHGSLFEWTERAPKNAPFGPAVLSGALDLDVDGVRLTVTRPVQYRYADRIRGELRRDLNVVPAVSLEVDPPLAIVPLSAAGKARDVAVHLVSHARRALAGSVRLSPPEGWQVVPAETPFALQSPGDGAVVRFSLTPRAGAVAGAYQVAAAAEVNGRRFTETLQTIAYPHIQTHRIYRPAREVVRLIDLQVAPVHVGYIMGSGDAVPEAIRRMGLDVTLLDAEALATGDLSQYDPIVVGIRASQRRPDFVSNHGRLLEYVRAGGTLIVQYQQRDYVAHGLPPFPAEMASRVTDEDAEVRILAPDHPAFNFPNRITPDDWTGWVQERNLYGFTTFDDRYTPLLESHDPGESAQSGGEVYARLGAGTYVYTAYSWFRELPAGVPGAYRLFANLLSLPAAPRGGEARRP